MRINVYAEEMTDEVELVTKTVTDDEFGERVFYGVRLFFKSPPQLHHSADDDDRSAITFWVKWTRADGTSTTMIGSAFQGMSEMVDEIEERVGIVGLK